MFTGPQITAVFAELGVTHVVYLPDSTLGTWEAALASSSQFELVRVCREGEAWVIAAGLHLGGKRPLVVMQSTGLFESGDALRNVYYDLQIPVWSLIGYRSYLLPTSTDSAKRFAEPILKAWALDYFLVERPDQLTAMTQYWRTSAEQGRPGVVLLAEGKG
jgi:sulfopyruvate decarboxylase TPP-binding subunit